MSRTLASAARSRRPPPAGPAAGTFKSAQERQFNSALDNDSTPSIPSLPLLIIPLSQSKGAAMPRSSAPIASSMTCSRASPQRKFDDLLKTAPVVSAATSVAAAALAHKCAKAAVRVAEALPPRGLGLE